MLDAIHERGILAFMRSMLVLFALVLLAPSVAHADVLPDDPDETEVSRRPPSPMGWAAAGLMVAFGLAASRAGKGRVA